MGQILPPNDPDLQSPICVRLTHAGLMLECGQDSNTILQVDSKGSRKSATLAPLRDGFYYPSSVY
ncbi:hypothetical protein DPMN_077312 [Dreissena polymorpha]|uniref:Uncharacterized protein n=1 Tax=Dreissena polymorpha TaxID=45954 RepID=A0A9D3YK89_DREPO|nr:hypothetical protein DPMN_077312 [Dreissena polymorpha]